MQVRNRDRVKPYVTKDGSEIREIVHPDNSPVKNQSFAEAVLKPGQQTKPHQHETAEEVYYVVQGKGEFHLESEVKTLGEKDCVVIPPGKKHSIKNTGGQDLVILCPSSPAYSHEDTKIKG
jgi:mannose-6-phosphate isomerase-like protein (cupin superfamily)